MNNYFSAVLSPCFIKHDIDPLKPDKIALKYIFIEKWAKIKPALEKFTEALAYESNRKDKLLVFEGHVTQAVCRLAKKVIKKKKLEKREGFYSYRQCNGDVFTIDIENKTCDCDRFLDKAACKHLAAACIKEQIAFNGLKLPKNVLLSRKRKARTQDSDEEPEDGEPMIQSDNSICDATDATSVTATPVTVTQVETNVFQENSNTEKPKRGRPTKAEQALRLEKGLEINNKENKTKSKRLPKQAATTDRVLRPKNN